MSFLPNLSQHRHLPCQYPHFISSQILFPLTSSIVVGWIPNYNTYVPISHHLSYRAPGHVSFWHLISGWFFRPLWGEGFGGLYIIIPFLVYLLVCMVVTSPFSPPVCNMDATATVDALLILYVWQRVQCTHPRLPNTGIPHSAGPVWTTLF